MKTAWTAWLSFFGCFGSASGALRDRLERAAADGLEQAGGRARVDGRTPLVKTVRTFIAPGTVFRPALNDSQVTPLVDRA